MTAKDFEIVNYFLWSFKIICGHLGSDLWLFFNKITFIYFPFFKIL